MSGSVTIGAVYVMSATAVAALVSARVARGCGTPGAAASGVSGACRGGAVSESPVRVRSLNLSMRSTVAP